MTIAGGFLSILLSRIGPAVAQFPARSHTWRVAVAAWEVSVPTEALVASAKLASVRVASPELRSDAVQPMLTSAACQAPSAQLQLTCGGVVSATVMLAQRVALALPLFAVRQI